MPSTHATHTSGFSYFGQGFSLIQVKGIRRFVYIPLTVNIVLFAVAFYYLLGQLNQVFSWMHQHLPSWLDWINYLLWPLAILMVLVVFSYFFSILANWLAAPFNGMLAEKIELYLTGQPIQGGGMKELMKDIPRTLLREWTKFGYYLPRAIGFLLLSFLLPFAGQLLWFLFTAWMMAIQYADYPFDNHKLPFNTLRQTLSADKGRSYGFGIAVTLFSMIPLVNFIVMPVAICGATAMWVEQYRSGALNSGSETG